MAHVNPPVNHPWGRWSHNIPHGYDMVNNQGFVVFDAHARPAGPEYLDRGLATPQYMMSPPPYSSAPIQNVAHSQYPAAQNANAATYPPYPSPPQLPAVLMSGRHHDQGHTNDSMSLLHNTTHKALISASCCEDTRSVGQCISPSPSIRSESRCSVTRPLVTNPPSNSKTITANFAMNPQDRVEFDTDVDQLMKAIQQDGNATDSTFQASTPVSITKNEVSSAASSPSDVVVSPSKAAGKPKRYICDGPNCNKSFTQKTHLYIHSRTHSGKRPYVCDFPDCNLRFSQLGNLKTHQRRHTGQKPFSCSKCDKKFAQKGNVKSHEETHLQKKSFLCRLDGCGKRFSQLGNMKTHQNNFHKEALKDLTSKMIRFQTDGYIPEEYRELIQYFQSHYKNSNKGIKGRGKARKVAGRTGPRLATEDNKGNFMDTPVVDAGYPGQTVGHFNQVYPIPDFAFSSSTPVKAERMAGMPFSRPMY